MKRIVLLLALILCLCACQPATAPTAAPVVSQPSATLPPATNTPFSPTATNSPVPPTLTAIPSPTILEISGPDGRISLSIEDIKALPSAVGQAGTKSSTGRITPPLLFKGVSLEEIAKLVGGLDPSLGLNIVAKDGYVMTLSYDQITQGRFIAYDPATGDERKMEEPLTVIVAYERDGQSISDDEGPLRLAILSPKNNQVTDGHWSVKWVERIELQPVGAEWDLELHGVIDDTIDRNTFQSCAAPGCHQATWVDDEGQTWSGTPLWLFAGRVDDQIQHDGPAFFDLFAQLGYSVQIVSTDGYSTTLEIGQVAYSDRNVLLASLVDDAPLPEKYFPIRLVGPGLQKNQMVGQVERVNLVFDPAKATQAASILPTQAPTATPKPTATPQPTVAIKAHLTVFGLVRNSLAVNESDLREMEIVKIEAEHPKKGMQTYEGVRLSVLLTQAGVKPDAATVVLTAGDGYSAEIAYADLAACKDCLIAFTDEAGIFQLVAPGLPSSIWVKNVTQIEIK